MKKSELFFNTILLPFDFLMIILAGLATYFFRTKILSSFRPVFFEFNLPFEEYILLVLLVAILFIVIFAVSGLYNLKTTTGQIEEFSRVVIASSAGVTGLIVFIFLRQELFNSRFLVLGGWVLTIIFVSLGRFLIRHLQKNLVARYDFGVHKVLVIGDDQTSRKITEDIKKNPSVGYRVVKHLENPEVEEIKSAVGNPGIDEVILANPNYPSEKVLEIVDFCNENHLIFKFVPNIYQTLTANFSVDILAGVPVIELRRTNLDGWGRVIKRTVDVVGGIFALIFFSPLFLAVAFAIKWETEGPVFVRLRRVSQNKEFILLKFRSMIKNAEELKPYLSALNERNDGPLFKIKNDPRITGVGKFIRRYRLDELPQFINVLKGDVSLVGPRPHQPDEVSRYEKHHKKVLSIKAGVTGLAQVSGSSALPFEEEVALDSFYIENWSLTQDLKILLKTGVKMLLDRSAV
ncbi:MAG: Undecaprenyl-phosphate glucose phosphotransferase [Parcubacteria group bacterium Gr01-1014_44]|nr:MAG: Undecaprenyl-phosphate glucose phosphotransferase [Parcubacteria group bacterium Gr01-1014_44]